MLRGSAARCRFDALAGGRHLRHPIPRRWNNNTAKALHRNPTTLPSKSKPKPKTNTKEKEKNEPPIRWSWRKYLTPPWEWHWREIASWSFRSFVVGHLFYTFVIDIRPTIGPSMVPTLATEGDYILLSKLHIRGKGVEVGDLVSYHHPVRQGYSSIKRVIGMPGDYVLRDTPGEGECVMIQIPKGHCWVAGDNLDGSRDSRHFGPLPLALVKGKVVARVWPWPSWYRNGLQLPDESG